MKIEIDVKELTALADLSKQQNAVVMKIEIVAKDLVDFAELLSQRNIDEKFLASLTDKVSAHLARQLEDALKLHDIS